MAASTEILSGLAEIVEEVAGIDTAEVTADKSFVDDLDIDSCRWSRSPCRPRTGSASRSRTSSWPSEDGRDAVDYIARTITEHPEGRTP